MLKEAHFGQRPMRATIKKNLAPIKLAMSQLKDATELINKELVQQRE